MDDDLQPKLEFDRIPVLWGVAVGAVVAAPYLLLYGNRIIVLLASALAGIAAAIRSDFYGQISTNGMIAAVGGYLLVVPVIFYQQYLQFGLWGMTLEDALLYASAYTAAYSIGLVPAAVIFGYTAASLTDLISRRWGTGVGG